MLDYSGMKDSRDRAARNAKREYWREIDEARRKYAEEQAKVHNPLPPLPPSRPIPINDSRQLQERLEQVKARAAQILGGKGVTVPEEWRTMPFPRLRDLAEQLEPDTKINNRAHAREIVARHAESQKAPK
jgi:hypothetical protein